MAKQRVFSYINIEAVSAESAIAQIIAFLEDRSSFQVFDQINESSSFGLCNLFGDWQYLSKYRDLFHQLRPFFGETPETAVVDLSSRGYFVIHPIVPGTYSEEYGCDPVMQVLGSSDVEG